MTKFLLSGHAGDGIGDRAGYSLKYVFMDVVSLPNSWKNEGYLTFRSHQERGD